jgi:hypothetical protein
METRMGYGMYIENRPASVEDNHFGLSEYSMRRYLKIMHTFGMVCADQARPAEPAQPDPATRKELDELSCAPLDEGRAVTAAAANYLHAHEEYLRWRDTDCQGIAGHKLRDNEGWAITPEEITEALNAYRAHDAEKVARVLAAADFSSDTWQEWIVLPLVTWSHDPISPIRVGKRRTYDAEFREGAARCPRRRGRGLSWSGVGAAR